jgi:hypothetical protein
MCQHVEKKNKKWGNWQLIIGIDFSGTIKREFYVVNIRQYFRSGSLPGNYYFYPYKNNLITAEKTLFTDSIGYCTLFVQYFCLYFVFRQSIICPFV